MTEEEFDTKFDEYELDDEYSDFILLNYQSHPAIKAPLSN